MYAEDPHMGFLPSSGLSKLNFSITSVYMDCVCSVYVQKITLASRKQ